MDDLLTASVLLFIVWPAYYLFIRFSQRFVVNRFLFLGGVIAVLLLPLSSVTSPTPQVTQSVQASIEYIAPAVPAQGEGALTRVQSVGQETMSTTDHTHGTSSGANQKDVYFDWWMVLGGGSVIVLLLLITRMASLIHLHFRARPGPGYYVLPPSSGDNQAYTIGQCVYISQNLINSVDLPFIIEHEQVHARQLHSVDILLSEVFCSVFWFHPFAWWLRSRLRANLEYLVDRVVVSGHTDSKAYQLALVRQSQGVDRLRLTLPFSGPDLHSRISKLIATREQRSLNAIAPVILILWIAVASVVVSGTIEADIPLADVQSGSPTTNPYCDHYEKELPGTPTAFYFITDRMLTGDEYLRLRAILGHLPALDVEVAPSNQPGAMKLIFHQGESPIAVIDSLMATRNQRLGYLNVNGSLGEESMEIKDGLNKLSFNVNLGPGGTYPSTSFAGIYEHFMLDGVSASSPRAQRGPFVRVNSQVFSLQETAATPKSIAKGRVLMHNRDITGLAADEWPAVFAKEHRTQTSPANRETQEFNLYFRRLPTPAEARQIDVYLKNFPETELSIYKSCSNNEGELTLKLGKVNDFGSTITLREGELLDQPHRIKLTRFGDQGSFGSATYRVNDGPAEMSDNHFLIELNGETKLIQESDQPTYPHDQLDALPPHENLLCKMYTATFGNSNPAVTLSGKPHASPGGQPSQWLFIYRDTGPETLAYLLETLKEHGYATRPTIFYVNDQRVSVTAFQQYKAGQGGYVQMGTFDDIETAPVIIQLIDQVD